MQPHERLLEERKRPCGQWTYYSYHFLLLFSSITYIIQLVLYRDWRGACEWFSRSHRDADSYYTRIYFALLLRSESKVLVNIISGQI